MCLVNYKKNEIITKAFFYLFIFLFFFIDGDSIVELISCKGNVHRVSYLFTSRETWTHLPAML